MTFLGGNDKVVVIANSNTITNTGGMPIGNTFESRGFALGLAHYYASVRGIPSANVLEIDFGNEHSMNGYQPYIDRVTDNRLYWDNFFAPIHAYVDGKDIRAILTAPGMPYRMPMWDQRLGLLDSHRPIETMLGAVRQLGDPAYYDAGGQPSICEYASYSSGGAFDRYRYHVPESTETLTNRFIDNRWFEGLYPSKAHYRKPNPASPSGSTLLYNTFDPLIDQEASLFQSHLAKVMTGRIGINYTQLGNYAFDEIYNTQAWYDQHKRIIDDCIANETTLTGGLNKPIVVSIGSGIPDTGDGQEYDAQIYYDLVNAWGFRNVDYFYGYNINGGQATEPRAEILAPSDGAFAVLNAGGQVPYPEKPAYELSEFTNKPYFLRFGSGLENNVTELYHSTSWTPLAGAITHAGRSTNSGHVMINNFGDFSATESTLSNVPAGAGGFWGDSHPSAGLPDKWDTMDLLCRGFSMMEISYLWTYDDPWEYLLNCGDPLYRPFGLGLITYLPARF